MTPELTRRQILAGMASLVIAAGCSNRGTPDTTDKTPDRGIRSDPYSLVALFDASGSALRAGSPQRLPYALGTADGVLIRRVPDEITMTITSPGRGREMSQQVIRHRSNSGQDYYPLSFTPPSPNRYEISTTLDGAGASGTFIVPEDDNVRTPQIGDQLPFEPTPTNADPLGVRPICSYDPPCPFHDTDLVDAPSQTTPIVLLVASPEYCLSGACPDAIGLLLDRREQLSAGVTTIHVEVYKDPEAGRSLIGTERVALVDRIGLMFEPCLFAADADGYVHARLDSIFDAGEVDDALAKIL